MTKDPETARFEADMPAFLRSNLDFISNMIIVVLAFGLRRWEVIRKEHIPGMQVLTFTLCLPALVFVVTWSSPIESSMLMVLAASAVTHALWCGAVALLLGVTRAEQKGMYFMTSTACSMAFVFPMILQSGRFGDASAAVAVMWDLGGNMIVAMVVFGMVARTYAPPPAVEASEATQLSGGSLRAGGGQLRARSTSCSSDPPPQLVGSSTAASDAAADGATLDGTPQDEEGGGSGATATQEAQASDALKWLRQAGVGLRNPMTLAAVTGLLLNVCQVPLYPLPVKAARAFMGAFPPLLYAFLGANLRFNLGRESYGFILRALIARWAMCAIVVGLGRLLWPVDKEARGVLTLCVVGPIASSFVMWSAKYSYPLDQVSMLFNVSAIASLSVMSLIAPVV